jgi:enoyl-CoA hydratase
MISIMVTRSAKSHNNKLERSPGVEERVCKAVTYASAGYCRILEIAADLEEESAESFSDEIEDLCDQIAWDEAARVVLLVFSGNLNDRLSPRSTQGSSPISSIAALKQPVIGAIRGDAMGPTLELALACDFRLGTENARFGFSQISEGLIPGNGGTQRLPRLIGPGRALQMILTGEPIDAAKACRIGLIHRVVASDALIPSAMQLAQDMAEKSPLSLSYAKEALYSGMDLTLDQGIKTELDLYLHLFTTVDRTEGITAFREKKKPKFKGI